MAFITFKNVQIADFLEYLAFEEQKKSTDKQYPIALFKAAGQIRKTQEPIEEWGVEKLGTLARIGPKIAEVIRAGIDSGLSRLPSKKLTPTIFDLFESTLKAKTVGEVAFADKLGPRKIYFVDSIGTLREFLIELMEAVGGDFSIFTEGKEYSLGALVSGTFKGSLSEYGFVPSGDKLPAKHPLELEIRTQGIPVVTFTLASIQQQEFLKAVTVSRELTSFLEKRGFGWKFGAAKQVQGQAVSVEMTRQQVDRFVDLFADKNIAKMMALMDPNMMRNLPEAHIDRVVAEYFS